VNESLPRRDFILIPLLALATVLAMLLAAEVGSRVAYSEDGGESCQDLLSGVPGKFLPNCVSRRKSAEGPVVENAYNDCGYRTPTACRPHPSGIIRVALMGSSTAEGFKVPYAETFAARLTERLSADCRRPVEFQNMGAPASMLDIYRRTDEALAMRPDAIMLVLGAIDLKTPFTRDEMVRREEPFPPPGPLAAAPVERKKNRSLVGWLSDLAVNSRALVVAQHFLYQDNATYVRLYMLHGEDADYLRSPLSPAWRRRLDDLGVLIGGMVSKAGARGVPVILAWSPTRIQAALMADATRPPNADPSLVGALLAPLAAREGATFIDTLSAFADQRAPERFFYAVDGHMNGDGTTVFADALRDKLLKGGVAPFIGCAPHGDRAAAVSR
jgi:hypothetical protein